jgi:hypothetical protein
MPHRVSRSPPRGFRGTRQHRDSIVCVTSRAQVLYVLCRAKRGARRRRAEDDFVAVGAASARGQRCQTIHAKRRGVRVSAQTRSASPRPQGGTRRFASRRRLLVEERAEHRLADGRALLHDQTCPHPDLQDRLKLVGAIRPSVAVAEGVRWQVDVDRVQSAVRVG